MHIPDGYLSPSTCACFYGACAPFWYVSLKRIKANLSSRSVPLLAVFAAFSFVIMMFNLPLPGGTTGHAVGMGVATIVLGPAVSIVAISIALLIQALFFGDGGITTYGANCFNMAIAGSIAAFFIYRIIAWKATLASPRRVLAAGLAGYGAINLAALLAAIEFGIQPIYFRDATGAPLYAPYPLRIAVPAMMIGHLTIAGFAEFIISSGLVRYLQRTDPEMLRLTALDSPHGSHPSSSAPTSRALWAILAVLLLLTPLGILAVGSAWGEWSPEQVGSPSGMKRLHLLWNAPFAGYSSAFIPNSNTSYFVSAVAGVALVLLVGYCLQWLVSRRRHRSFVETSIRHLIVLVQKSLFAEESALAGGLLQRLDPRVKLAGFAALLLAILFAHRLWVLLVILLSAVVVARLSNIAFGAIARAWLAVLAFTGLIAIPAIFVTPGTFLYSLPGLHWSITAQGLRSSAFLLLRSEAATTLALLLLASTLWNRLLRALRSFHVPATIVVLLGMTYRYIFLFLQTAQSMLESRQTKLVGRLSPSDQRRLATASIGVLLDKSMQLSSDLHLAMQARGFRGEVHVLEESAMRPMDWLHLASVLLLACLALWMGH